jgi:hypothetical protein
MEHDQSAVIDLRSSTDGRKIDMGNGQLSVGDDTSTGEPENGPRGPYITDKDDGTRKFPPIDKDERQRPDDDLPSRTETEITKRSELGSDG